MASAQSFSRPETRPDEIHALLTGVERYNPQKIGVLEDYLAHQCANPDPSTNHDLMANLALLKMYQFNPPMLDLDVVRRILAKALVSMSQGDFNLCLYLLSEEICQDASVAKLLALRDSLERAQFDSFWSEMYGGDEDEESVVDGIAGFDNGLRKLVLAEITSTYQTIQARLVGKMVNLDEEAVLRLAKEHGWAVSDAGIVSLPLRGDNEAKTTVIKESIQFEQLTKILCAANSI